MKKSKKKLLSLRRKHSKKHGDCIYEPKKRPLKRRLPSILPTAAIRAVTPVPFQLSSNRSSTSTYVDARTLIITDVKGYALLMPF